MNVVTRFAPSPTGHLHIGGARTAIFCWLMARHYKGQFHLRIEDTDLLRSKQEYTDSILASMKWLGLDWDGELTYQTQRMDLYRQYVNRLLESGQAYWCSCTAEEVDAMRQKAKELGLKPRYNGHCRDLHLGPGEGRCVRLKCPQEGKIVFDDMVKGRIAVDVSELDDMVLQRADGTPTYNAIVERYGLGATRDFLKEADPFHDAESDAEYWARVEGAYALIAANAELKDGDDVLVIGHGNTLLSLMHRFAPAGYDLSERPANGSVTVLDFDTEKPFAEALSVVSYNQ